MNRSISIVVLLGTLACCAPSHAAISRTGSIAANGTSGTLSAVNANDLVIVCAFNNASTTLPTLPSGWTSILTISGFSRATRCGCSVATSSSDTGTDTWTTATKVEGVAYSGTSVNTTANCNTTGVGGSASTSNSIGSGSSINYPAITMSVTNGTSWVQAYGGESANDGISTAPAGMTNITSQGTGPKIAVHDTNAGVTSWASTNVTSTAATVYHTAVIEIKASSGGATSTPRQMMMGVGD